jgi:hypothetical protein
MNFGVALSFGAVEFKPHPDLKVGGYLERLLFADCLRNEANEGAYNNRKMVPLLESSVRPYWRNYHGLSHYSYMGHAWMGFSSLRFYRSADQNMKLDASKCMN